MSSHKEGRAAGRPRLKCNVADVASNATDVHHRARRESDLVKYALFEASVNADRTDCLVRLEQRRSR